MALKLRSVYGDGRSAAGDEFDLVVKDPATGESLDDVVIRCRALSRKRGVEIARAFQRQAPDPKTRQVTWQFVDDSAQQATTALAVEAIVSWRGIVGADDRDLVCLPATIAQLDDAILAQVLGAVFGAEVVAAQSFREPARVVSMAPHPREERPVLSAGG